MMDFLILIDTISMDLSVLYFKESYVKNSKFKETRSVTMNIFSKKIFSF